MSQQNTTQPHIERRGAPPAPAGRPPAWVRDYVGLPHENGARGPDRFDCYGLLAVAGNKHYGLKVPLKGHLKAVQTGSNREFYQEAAALLADLSDWPEVADPRPGDGVRLRVGDIVCHVGLVVAVRPTAPGQPPRGHMLHVTRGIRVSCEEWHNSAWANRVVSFHRFKPRPPDIENGGGNGPA